MVQIAVAVSLDRYPTPLPEHRRVLGKVERHGAVKALGPVFST
jgi:hypothetical protein